MDVGIQQFVSPHPKWVLAVPTRSECRTVASEYHKGRYITQEPEMRGYYDWVFELMLHGY